MAGRSTGPLKFSQQVEQHQNAQEGCLGGRYPLASSRPDSSEVIVWPVRRATAVLRLAIRIERPVLTSATRCRRG
jgi:hypothetical protein